MENIETLLAAVAQTQGFSDDEDDLSVGRKVGVEGSVSVLDNRRDSGASQLTDVPPAVGVRSELSAVVNKMPKSEIQVVPTNGVVIGATDKRKKRGRPLKGQLAERPPPPKRKKQEDEEEDVCFICFDGGSLVLCDRKGCPKAYHPACIKRDEAFFRSKAKWNCGWHLCITCQKPSHYMCYTCTYSLCNGCAKNTDYLSVRGKKGFCSMCLKTIMLIENKDQANEDAVQVDFDDKTSWEYLFKVYWTCLKDNLFLTLRELTQAKSPWKVPQAVASKPRLINMNHPAHDGNAISYMSSVHSESRKPHEGMGLLQDNQLSMVASSIQNHVGKLISDEGESVVGTGKLSVSKDTDKPGFDKNTDKPSTSEVSISENAIGQVVMEKNKNNQGIGKDTDNPAIGKEADKQRRKGMDKPEIVKDPEWASTDLLEFVGHVKNGDISPLSQFDVQRLLLEYVKRNNLRDPRQKSHIICDHSLKNLFGKHRVGHIEMMQLLEFHFLTKEDSPSSFIPAGFVGSTASDVEVDGNTYSSLITNSKKRKARKKSEDGALQNKLNGYAAIDVHNINLICLRRNLLENLIEDKDNFHDKVVGSIVKIRISAHDQKQDIYRLVQVVGTSKVAEPYKFGDKTTVIMLEVLNLDKKEVVSLDAISNSAVTEDECRRLRQIIRCGLVKHFTVGEVQKKAMELQPVRLNELLEAEILRLNHLRDRASEKGHKKELREHVHKLQLLKSPEERQRRIAEIPVVHNGPKISQEYESEEDVRNADNTGKGELRPKSSIFTGNGRNPISPDKKGKREGSMQAQNKLIERVDASGSHSSDINMSQDNIANPVTIGMDVQAMLRSVGLETSTASHSVGNSPSANNIETEKLWHYRDPNGKIQGPFAMLQLRKWNTTGLFPHNMRIWTNHEQYDSLLLTDALNRQFNGSSDLPCNLSTESPNLGVTGGDRGVNGPVSYSDQAEMALCDDSNVLSGNSIGSVRADDSGTSHPRAWDFLKHNSSSADNVQVRSSHPTYAALPDRSQDPQNEENTLSELNQNQITSGLEIQNQCNNRCQAVQSSEENMRTLPVDLSSMEFESTSAPVSMSMESIKQDRNTYVPNLPCVAPKTIDKLVLVETAEEQQSVSLDVPMQNPGILELLSPTPRANNENQGDQVTQTKQYDFINFIVPNAGPSWSSSSRPVVGNLQLPEVADEWCGYSPTPAKPSGQEWHSGLLSPSSLKLLEDASDNVTTTTSNNGQITHASPPTIPNWLAIFNEPIEFDALGEESVSDLLAEVDAMESQGGGFPSPTSAMKFAKELIQDCKDDCFSSIEFSHIHDPGKNDALSSTGDIQLACQPSVPCKPAVESSFIDGLESFRRSSVHSSASSEGETNAPVYPGEGGSEFHPPASVNTSQEMVGATMVFGTGSESNDPGWGTVQGNINLVTVQGNVNLVLGGPTQGMTNLSWGTNPGSAWGNPGVNLSPVNGNLPWDGQRKYSSPREWGYQGGEPGGFGRGRPPWGRQQYGGSGGGGGYSRPPPKGQRVCKFYESGRCKKGAFCDYLHP